MIEGIQHVFDRRQWETSWNLSPLIYGQFGPGGGNNNCRYLRLNTVVGDADRRRAMLASNPPVDTDKPIGELDGLDDSAHVVGQRGVDRRGT